MKNRNFLRPFVSSVATLLVTTQAGATIDHKLPLRLVEEAKIAQPSPVLDVTLTQSASSEVFAAHASHSSHSSHASHSSHSSSSF